MTTFYLIRHGQTDALGEGIAGRACGIRLNPVGKLQAERLAAELANVGLHKIFFSPLERCCETAEALSRATGVAIEPCEAIQEVDFGQWTLRTFDELEKLADWKQWNAFRSRGQAPAGETMAAVQARFVDKVIELQGSCPEEKIALVSHADPIRAALTYFLGMPLDNLLRLEISPASVTVLHLNEWSATLAACNHTTG